VDFEERRPGAEKQLIEFLRTDLELARIFVDSASRQLKRGELEDYGKLLRQAAKAINTIHYFGEKISEHNIRAEIQHELEELEDRLFSNKD
jgi:hypothetical protein